MAEPLRRQPPQPGGVGRSLVDGLSDAAVGLFRGIEGALIGRMAQTLRQPVALDRWVSTKLSLLQRLRMWVEKLLTGVDSDLPAVIEQAVTEAWQRGAVAATTDIAHFFPHPIGPPIPDPVAVSRLTTDTVERIRATEPQIFQWAMNSYREVVNVHAAGVLDGSQTRLQASQAAWAELTSKGITGFVDKAGRNWELSTYVEMAMRTATAHAAIEGQLARLEELGVDLVIVSDSPQECKLCLIPGTVVEGPAPTWRTRSEYTGDIVSITTASGKDLTGTPDHPVLTLTGWRALKDLKPGDKVISHNGEQRYPGVVPDDVQVPALIEEAGESRAPLLLAGPSRRDLDCDVSYREVKVVWPNRKLLNEFNSPIAEPGGDLDLVGGIGRADLRSSDGNPVLPLLGERYSASGVVGGLDQVGPLLGGGVLPAPTHGVADHGRSLVMGKRGQVGDDGVMSRTSLDSRAPQVVADHSGTDAECWPEGFGALPGLVAVDDLDSLLSTEFPKALSGADWLDTARCEAVEGLPMADVEGGLELLDRLAGTVAADEIVDVRIGHYSGHVWDLSTEPAWFIANGIVTHNCRPWEGQVLARKGLPGARTVQVEHGIHDGEMVTVHIAGTVSEAVGFGLLHPNCRHSISAFLPGVTKPHKNTEDVKGDKARRRLREIERNIRSWKRREIGALTEIDRAHASRQVASWKAEAASHVKATGLHRQPQREEIGAGNIPGHKVPRPAERKRPAARPAPLP